MSHKIGKLVLPGLLLLVATTVLVAGTQRQQPFHGTIVATGSRGARSRLQPWPGLALHTAQPMSQDGTQTFTAQSATGAPRLAAGNVSDSTPGVPPPNVAGTTSTVPAARATGSTPTSLPTDVAGSTATMPASRVAGSTATMPLPAGPTTTQGIAAAPAESRATPASPLRPSPSGTPAILAAATPPATATAPAHQTTSPLATPPGSPPRPTPSPASAGPTAVQATPDVPVLLEIPRLDVSAHVEPVGFANGAMGTPQNPWDVAWLTANPRPGQAGNAVIDGHLDTATGIAVFWHLDELQIGDNVTVTTRVGETLLFTVTDVELYTTATAPLDRIFGPADTPQLNLITCAGTWDASKQLYDQRLVVYTQLSAVRVPA